MEEFKLKAARIKMLLCDVDGILSNGVLYYGDNQIELKGFHTHDGLGIKLLKKCGIIFGIISGKTSSALRQRIKELDIQHAYLNIENKLPVYEEILNITGLQHDEVAYMGDDLPDLPILERVGLPITVPQAPLVIKENALYVTSKLGGEGAVREVCDFIIASQGKTQLAHSAYCESK